MTTKLARSLALLVVVSTFGCSDSDPSKTSTTNNQTGADMGTMSDMPTADTGGEDVGASEDVGAADMAMGDAGNADASECGNRVVEPGEDCDDGNASDDDECLSDCTFACGDGVLNSVELCDPGIAAGEAGACPTDCDDNDACTTGTLQGTGCQLECVFGEITACVADDGCCAAGCDANTDNDCAVTCGNNAIETGETCDPPGSCVTSCDDNDACTTNVLSGSALTCDSACSYPAITVCVADGCCPTVSGEVAGLPHEIRC